MADHNLFTLYDIIARNYGVLPSSLRDLSWEELLFNLHCLKGRSDRLQSVLRKTKRKKTMLFPVISLGDVADMIDL
tara:strand:+ start:3161 stop:3388 length:228 start_codon:yes stop_codon:yes gene_type:complete